MESRILYLVNAIIITILIHMDTPYSAVVAPYSGEACVPVMAICDVPSLKGMLIRRMRLLFSISAKDASRPSSSTAKGLSERKSLFLESIIFLPSSIVNVPGEADDRYISKLGLLFCIVIFSKLLEDPVS